jgi:selenide, water dikinase
MLHKDKPKLTQFAHGAGCGCKIAPLVLQQILQGSINHPQDRRLIAGNGNNEDAAVYELENDLALIATTDFFTPIVDDAFDFGRVAAANAISDVYAMGGRPVLALAILGWPIDNLGPETASLVIDGARSVCNDAGITLAGGHTIDSPEPVFGLAVNGLVKKKNIKRNNTAKEGDLLFITKPLGTGILSTAQKRGVLQDSHFRELMLQMGKLNSIGQKLGTISSVNSMTDVTGFGLLGHLAELCEGSGLAAEIQYSRIPRFGPLAEYIKLNTIPDATFRNWNAYSNKVEFAEGVDAAEAFSVLPDPQTNGGLLFSVERAGVEDVQELLKENDLAFFCEPIGRMVSRAGKLIRVQK